jgi:AraC-like DNA-binding protein
VSYDQRILLDDELLVVSEASCGAAPPAAGDPERADRLEIVIPQTGVFVRHVRARRGWRDTISDASRALFFRPDEPYRVSHPLGGHDRSIDVAVPWAMLDTGATEPARLPDSVAVDWPTSALVRRWARALSTESCDPLTASEIGIAVIDRILPGPEREVVPAPIDPLVERARLAVAERLGERLTLPELGTLLDTSPFQLARRFRTATGSSIHGYRTTLRVRTALSRVEAGERDLTGLALDLGFVDHSHLTNVVRRHAGRPPSAFRPLPTVAELRALRTILQA